MAKISPNQFRLISGTNKLVLRTLDIGVPVTSSGGGDTEDPFINPPSYDEVDIEGVILNPNMVGFDLPTKKFPSTEYEISPLSNTEAGEVPDYTFPPSNDGEFPPYADSFIWQHNRSPVITVEPGLYSHIVASETYIKTVVDIPSTTQAIDSGWTYTPSTETRYLANNRPVSARRDGLSSTFPDYTPVSVVEWIDLSTVDPALEWYAPGWWVLKLNIQTAGLSSMVEGADYWWTTAVGSFGYTIYTAWSTWCRYNPDTDPVLGTYHDEYATDPGAAINVGMQIDYDHPLGPVPGTTPLGNDNDYQWYFVKFMKGSPADFPVGQRLQSLISNEFCNSGAINSVILGGTTIDFFGNESTYLEPIDPSGNIQLQESGIGLSSVPKPYPAVMPYPSTPGDETDPYIGSLEDTDLFELHFKLRLRKA